MIRAKSGMLGAAMMHGQREFDAKVRAFAVFDQAVYAIGQGLIDGCDPTTQGVELLKALKAFREGLGIKHPPGQEL